MSEITYEKLRKHISEKLNTQVREFHQTVESISENFRNLGLGIALWHPERIHTANIGGLDADSYVGYSRIEGKWGLNIRTIELHHETHAFVSQRVYPIESCGNMEIVANAMEKIPELIRNMHAATENQIDILSRINRKVMDLKNPECKF
jgi:hypothetical protein